MGIKLIGVDGPMRGKFTELSSGTYRIGRGSHCDVQLPEDDNASRDHAVIRISNGSAMIQDNESKNGTWVNNQRVLNEDLRDGDTVRIGDCVFKVKEIGTEGPVLTPPPSPPEKVYGGFWIRFASLLIDVLAVCLPLSLLYSFIVALAPGIVMSIAANYVAWSVVVGIVTIAAFTAYFTYMDGSTGQTLGRMATRTKVVRSDGGPIDYNQALTRLLVGWGLTIVAPLIVLALAYGMVRGSVSSFNFEAVFASARFAGFLSVAVQVYVIYYFIMLAAHPRKQGWHDLIADTQIVKVKDN